MGKLKSIYIDSLKENIVEVQKTMSMKLDVLVYSSLPRSIRPHSNIM